MAAPQFEALSEVYLVPEADEDPTTSGRHRAEPDLDGHVERPRARDAGDPADGAPAATGDYTGDEPLRWT